MNYNKIAAALDQASRDAQSIAQISHSEKFNLNEAYAIQSISMFKRLMRGEILVGMKLGFTSKAKMEQMGVHDMIWGRLTDKMHYDNGGQLDKSNFIHPRAEPEIAFLVKKDITQSLSLDEVGEYIAGVSVAIEIIDSRFENFKFSLVDVIADNCSSSAFVVGDWKMNNWSVDNLEMQLLVDGKLEREGNSNAILGNPLASFVAASRLYAENGLTIKAGDIVLAGAATAAIYIESGQRLVASADGLGEVSLDIV